MDGNQTSDGRWNYTWDAENRLIRLVANTAVGPQQRMDFEYDWQGRRIGKKVWNNTGGTGTPATHLKFVYDGWNLIAELDGNNANAVKRSFIWGLDLSGSEQGAGGVGGLLAIKPASGNPTFAAYDGNGNVTGLIDATTGTISGNFEYGPFGETIRLTPNANNQSPFRFSTKYTDDESDLLYYGYRYYNPSTGRWLTKDRIEEQGGKNLYGFAANSGLNRVDALGLSIVCKCPESYFRENGITPDMYNHDGDRYFAKSEVEGPRAGAGEILWKMLQDDRTFKAAGRSVAMLKQHVLARQNVIRATFLVWWPMEPENGKEFWNDEFWSAPMELKSGKDPVKAVNDPFLYPMSGKYQTGCKSASMLVLLKGIADTVPDQFQSLGGGRSPYIDQRAIANGLIQFRNVGAGGAEPLKNWVPGDRGYLKGSGHGLMGGEYIIYLGGGDNFWGLWTDREESVRTIEDWAREMNSKETGNRWYPGVGLEK